MGETNTVVKSINWEDVFWRTFVGPIVYTFTQDDMQVNDLYYLKSIHHEDGRIGASEFKHPLKQKQLQYEQRSSLLYLSLTNGVTYSASLWRR